MSANCLKMSHHANQSGGGNLHLRLTHFQRGEKLLDLPMLGANKSFELMHQMLELCPKRDETRTLYQCLLLRRLPADLSTLLAHLDHSKLKEIARKADELWALKPCHDVLAVIQPEDVEGDQETIDAVSGSAPCGAVLVPREATSRGSPTGGEELTSSSRDSPARAARRTRLFCLDRCATFT